MPGCSIFYFTFILKKEEVISTIVILPGAGDLLDPITLRVVIVAHSILNFCKIEEIFPSNYIDITVIFLGNKYKTQKYQ